ncbi:F0F1 ATP synthase subunit delta [Candidatus Kaiserbacteria bacterium]|nr:F0F1 ATP synthase subunit delta [Candidatus Kaiserbacteria bacterium]
MQNAYAQALWQLIEGGMEPEKAVHAIHTQLEAQGRTELMPRIARAFERLAARERTRSTMTLTIAHKGDEAHARKEALAALEKLNIPALRSLGEEGETHIDASLIGGWRLEGQGHLIDASYKKHLLAIYQAATT